MRRAQERSLYHQSFPGPADQSLVSRLMYVELHCHSCFSLLDGAALPEALVARASALGYPAIALTDHDELGGAVRFAQAASELEVHGIIGAEMTVEAWASGRGRDRKA